MQHYVVGFLFNWKQDRVVLIRKTKPDWQAGKLNGVGGKIELGETPYEAMAREFQEETGVAIDPSFWIYVAVMANGTRIKQGDVYLHVFAAKFANVLQRVRQTTEEIPSVFTTWEAVNHPDVLHNLRWLIPLCSNALQHCCWEPIDMPNGIR